MYFSFSNFSELIREAAPLVLFGPSPYFMEGLEYKLVTITLSMVKGAENVKWEILRDETYYIYVQSFYLSKGQRYPLESLPNPALACARPLGCLSKVFFIGHLSKVDHMLKILSGQPLDPQLFNITASKIHQFWKYVSSGGCEVQHYQISMFQ